MPRTRSSRLAPAAAFTLVVLAAVPERRALAYFETHLDEIAAPVADYAAARIAEIDTIENVTPAEKRERAKLVALGKRLAKEARTLANDFTELLIASQAVRGLPDSPDADTAADEAFRRAGLALSERSELLQDHAEPAIDSKTKAKIAKTLAAVAALRGDAAAEPRLDKRARTLQRAEKSLTSTLRIAEKAVRKGGFPLPPARYRSGDTIGAAGGRVAIPKDSTSPLAGSSVVFAPGAFVNGQTITVGEGADLIEAPVEAAGPALVVAPEGLVLNAPITVNVRYALPLGREAADLDLAIDDGTAVTYTGAVEQRSGGLLRSTTTRLGSYQAALLPPPTGQPTKTYSIVTFTVATSAGMSSGSAGPAASFSAGLQQIEFRRSGSGRTTLGGALAATRVWNGNAPHHSDVTGGALTGSFDFAWETDAEGTFTFDIPFGTTTANAKGIVSQDTDVISFTARGDGVQIFGIGLRAQSGAATADLAGRWVASEIGARLTDPSGEPFTTIFTDLRREFTVTSGGAVTYSSAGTVRTTATTYRSQDIDPVHVISAGSTPDSSNGETWTLAADGSLTESTSQRTGIYDASRGILVTRVLDAVNGTVRVGVAVRQPSGGNPSAPVGGWNVVRFDLGQTQGSPDARSSTFETLGRTGMLVPAAGSLEDSLFAGTRNVHALSTSLSPGVTWSLTQSAGSVTGTIQNYAFGPDVDGNFSSGDQRTDYRMSGDGRTVIGTATDDGSRRSRGIVFGLR